MLAHQRRPSGANNGDNDVNTGNADSDTPKAADAKENVPVT